MPPLRIAALVKQVPAVDTLSLRPDGRLDRSGLELEMNAYCRRAVSKGVELARASGGSCTVYTLGPPAAEEVLREAIAWGADRGVHLCDRAFAGSDTLATATALAAALRLDGPFDLVLVGRNTLDGDTGQVGPELAQLTGLPFAGGVRALELTGRALRLTLEEDDGGAELELTLPALLSVAERLCEPCKVDAAGREAVPAGRIRRYVPADLGHGPWGEAGSPTRVGAVRAMANHRLGQIMSGSVEEQVAEAVGVLRDRGALAGPATGPQPLEGSEAPRPAVVPTPAPHPVAGSAGAAPAVVVILEPGRPKAAAELLGAASALAAGIGGEVIAFGPPAPDDPDPGAAEIIELPGGLVAEDVAAALTSWVRQRSTGPPWAVLAPSTAFGREVAGRAAASLQAGLVGDAIALDVADSRLIAAKPAFSGALVADITCTSATQMVTVRTGVLPLPSPPVGGPAPRRVFLPWAPSSRVQVVSRHRNDDVEVLARAEVVIGVGSAVHPDEYASLGPLAATLGAELAATRKVTDKGWAPRSRQVGITGRSIAPRLYVAVGLSGKFNHMAGVRAAGTVLAINADSRAPVFAHADIGIVADWHLVLPLLNERLRSESTIGAAAAATLP